MPSRYKGKWKYHGRTESHEHHEIVNKGQTVLCNVWWLFPCIALQQYIFHITGTCHTVILQCENMARKNMTIQQSAATKSPLKGENLHTGYSWWLHSQKSHHIYIVQYTPFIQLTRHNLEMTNNKPEFCYKIRKGW